MITVTDNLQFNHEKDWDTTSQDAGKVNIDPLDFGAKNECQNRLNMIVIRWHSTYDCHLS
jgi:hypothetical protein